MPLSIWRVNKVFELGKTFKKAERIGPSVFLIPNML